MKSNQATISGGAAGLGGTGLGTSGGQRLPSSPRERKPALAALALLLILGGALASAYLVMASGERVSAIRIAQPVAAGQPIPASALEEVQVGDTGIQYLAWSERAKVTRHIAAVPLVRGALLTNSMISPADAPSSGRLIVGLALKPGQFPSGADVGLSVGRHVMLYAVGGATNGGPRPGTVLSQDAIVVGMSGDDGGSGGLGGTRLRSEQTTVSVAVPPADAPLVTQAASAGTIAVALIPAGTNAAPPPATPGKPGDQQQTPPAGGNQNPGGTPGGQNPGGSQGPGGTVPIPGNSGAPPAGTGGN
ncbi:hypothetical protein ETD83_31475 [Actinomadura soli]|uniref:SAF domain-containing protein n=1 Tax=Actinomadura soli TaxID=2508997 RepID=A0A5C4J3J8_9ACTN|nr:hypothetical protein [Actinomadura soli]TMQ91313.1 hypothetical protein ETD83_31475 [Actinomadura soli]